MERNAIIEKVSRTLIEASSTFSESKIKAYHNAVETETNESSNWWMNTLCDNESAARLNGSPLCDDSGIPHLIVDIGSKRLLSGETLDAIYEGVREGLRRLPGRPMAVLGDDMQRIEQCAGLDSKSEAVVPTPLLLRYLSDEPVTLRLTVLMQGGGPEIRAKTYRVFHNHSRKTVADEIVMWAKEAVSLLGCTPCTLAIGIGRSHYEASALMLQAMADGDYAKQNDFEREITQRINETGVGALGLGGDYSVLASFVRVGPQRASGVRIVCMRPCCCFEPRRASVEL